MKFTSTTATALLAIAITSGAGAQGCVGDVAVDRRVDGGDLGVLLANWGPVTGTALSRACDFDNSGQVDGADLAALLAGWGACPWAAVIESLPNPAVVPDAAIRSAIASTGLPWRVRDVESGIEMLLVPPGTFLMGCVVGSNQFSCANSSEELPPHQVTLTEPFYIGRYEVTQAQWVSNMGGNPSRFQGANYPDAASRPVEQVSYGTAFAFLNDTGLRLPTEAEWEYACRAGTITPFYNGSTLDSSVGDIAWYGSCCNGNGGDGTHAVGGKLPNGFGLYDMLGNVLEMTSDWYGPYGSDAQINPTGPSSGLYRVVRGGSWQSQCRSSMRTYMGYSHWSDVVGFRVARDP